MQKNVKTRQGERIRIRIVLKAKRDKVRIYPYMEEVTHDGKREGDIIRGFSYVFTSTRRENHYHEVYLFVKDNFDEKILDTIDYSSIAHIKKAYREFSLSKGANAQTK